MKKLEIKIADILYSDECWVEDEAERFLTMDQVDKEEILNGNISCFFANKPEFREYCELYAKIKEVKPFAMLNAHGQVKNEWKYKDANKFHSIQSWIKQNEKKYGTLLLNVCNEPGYNAAIPKSKQAIVVFSNGTTILGLPSYGAAEFNFEFFIPKIGIVDGYEIDYYLNRLKQRRQ
jgi:hypothetical protein